MRAKVWPELQKGRKLENVPRKGLEENVVMQMDMGEKVKKITLTSRTYSQPS